MKFQRWLTPSLFCVTVRPLRRSTAAAESVSEDRVIKHMVGREMADRYPKRTSILGETVFEVKN